MLKKLIKTKSAPIIFGTVFCAVLFFIFSAAAAGFFYFFDINRKYISFASTLCLAAAAFLSSFSVARKNGDKGLVTGAAIGGVVFAAVTLISIFTSKRITANTLFHFVFTLLPAMTGGIIGVNFSNKKII